MTAALLVCTAVVRGVLATGVPQVTGSALSSLTVVLSSGVSAGSSYVRTGETLVAKPVASCDISPTTVVHNESVTLDASASENATLVLLRWRLNNR